MPLLISSAPLYSWVEMPELRMHMQVGFLHGISFVSFFRYTINAFIRLQYAERDDGCGLMPAVTPEQVCTTHAQSIHPAGFDQTVTLSLQRHCCWP